MDRKKQRELQSLRTILWEFDEKHPKQVSAGTYEVPGLPAVLPSHARLEQ
jgi:hypothetical protein